MFDRLVPSELGLSDDDKERLGRQGLLSIASGLLSNGGGFGNALGEGIKGGLLSMNQGADDMSTRRYKQMLMAQQGGDPTAVREFKALTEAAGYTPGSAEYKKAAGTHLGTVAREVSGAAKMQEFTGRDGIKRPGYFDPSTRQFKVMNDQGGFDTADPNGYQPASPAPTPGGGLLAPAPDAEFTSFASAANGDAASRGEPPLSQPELMTIYRQMKAGQPVNSAQPLAAPQINGGLLAEAAPPPALNQGLLGDAVPQQVMPTQGLLSNSPPRAQSSNPSMFIGRRPEDEARAITSAQEQAKIDAQVGNAPRVAGAEAQVTTANELARDDIARVTTARADAGAAQEQLNSLNAIDSILSNTGTGKPQEFYARASQYFGMPAGATFQAQQALVNEQVNAILNAAKGPQTD